jgi:hypothetical protein
MGSAERRVPAGVTDHREEAQDLFGMYLIDMLKLSKRGGGGHGRHLFSTEEESRRRGVSHDRLPCLLIYPYCRPAPRDAPDGLLLET